MAMAELAFGWLQGSPTAILSQREFQQRPGGLFRRGAQTPPSTWAFIRKVPKHPPDTH